MQKELPSVIIIEGEKWTRDDPQIIDHFFEDRIRKTFHDSPIIAEHIYFKCETHTPDRSIFTDAEYFLTYVKNFGLPGDSFLIWDYNKLCTVASCTASGKYPTNSGYVPCNGKS